MTTLKGGKPAEPYAGKASTTVTFSEPGDYLLHVTVNDCRAQAAARPAAAGRRASIKVAVKGTMPPPTGR